MNLINQEPVYLPLVVNLSKIVSQTGNNVACEFKNKTEHDYIATTIKSQLNIDTPSYDKDGVKAGIIILPLVKDKKPSHTIEVVDFNMFKFMCTNYITNAKTEDMNAVEHNFNDSQHNKLKQRLVDLCILFSALFILTLINLNITSSRVNASNKQIALLLMILVYAILVILLSGSSKSKIFYSKGYSPPRYQRMPYQWIKIYLLFDLAITLISLIDFNANFGLLLKTQFYQAKWKLYLFELLIMWSLLPHQINL